MSTLKLKPKDEAPPAVTLVAAQVPARKWGDHSLMPGGGNAPVDAFGNHAAQVMPASKGGSISPPPSRNFR